MHFPLHFIEKSHCKTDQEAAAAAAKVFLSCERTTVFNGPAATCAFSNSLIGKNKRTEGPWPLSLAATPDAAA